MRVTWLRQSGAFEDDLTKAEKDFLGLLRQSGDDWTWAEQGFKWWLYFGKWGLQRITWSRQSGAFAVVSSLNLGKASFWDGLDLNNVVDSAWT